MGADEVRERLLRLNEEIHSDRFKDADVSGVLQLWENAKAEYEAENYGYSEQIIDQAYRVLYGQGQDTQVAPASVVDSSQQTATPVFMVYDEEPDMFSKVFSGFSGSTGLLLQALIQPRRVFRGFEKENPVNETLMSFTLFGLVAAAAAVMSVLPVIGFDVNVIWFAAGSLVIGFLFCILASAILYAIAKAVGGTGDFTFTSSVYGFGLTPITACVVLLAYLDQTTTFFDVGVQLTTENIVGAGGLMIAALICFVWSVVVQAIGLSEVHGLSFKKALAASAGANLIICSVIFLVLFTVGAASFIILFI